MSFANRKLHAAIIEFFPGLEACRAVGWSSSQTPSLAPGTRLHLAKQQLTFTHCFTVRAVYTSTISFELYNYVWSILYISLLFINPFL